MKSEIIFDTHPQVVTIRGNALYDSNEQIVEIDQAAYDAEAARLEAEYAATEYKRLRAQEYPPIGDQLDAILKEFNYRRLNGDNLVSDLDAIVADWLAVKTRFPKNG